jgi:hypothetical protein
LPGLVEGSVFMRVELSVASLVKRHSFKVQKFPIVKIIGVRRQGSTLIRTLSRFVKIYYNSTANQTANLINYSTNSLRNFNFQTTSSHFKLKFPTTLKTTGDHTIAFKSLKLQTLQPPRHPTISIFPTFSNYLLKQIPP